MWTYLNDAFVPLEQARVSILDRGFLYGDGLFETLAAYDGTLFRLDAHLDRLVASADYLGISIPLDRCALGERLYACLAKNGMRDGVLRISLSRGVSGPGLSTRGAGAPTLAILCFAPRLYPARMVEVGATVTVASVQRVPPEALSPLVKTTNFLNNIVAFREAEERGADEALMLNGHGELAEGSVSNVFLVRAGRLCTPSLACGAMAGITRAAVLELARAHGLPCDEQRLRLATLDEAQEVFYTNTTATIMPIARIDQREYGPLGTITRWLRRELHALIGREAGRFWRDGPAE